jgi:hypothetical protein
MAEHQVMSWLPKHHSNKRDLVSHPNVRVQVAARQYATWILSFLAASGPRATLEGTVQDSIAGSGACGKLAEPRWCVAILALPQ